MAKIQQQEEEEVSTDEKVRFLRDKKNYPETTDHFAVKETHMSWLFFSDEYVYKMKKPVQYSYLDFSNLTKREKNCHEEVRLNKRLAPYIYKGVVALTQDKRGKFHLEGSKKVIEWLVKMERLPEAQMMDQKIYRNSLEQKEVLLVARFLSAFYKTQNKQNIIEEEQYIERLINSTNLHSHELKRSEFKLKKERVEKLLQQQLKFLSDYIKIFKRRAGKIIEAHGDLKPDHICLKADPAIIDCLEFNKDLRLLDPAEELSFLAMECEMLGASWVGDTIIKVYQDETNDYLNSQIIDFYKSRRAVLRSLSSFQHILDPHYQNDSKWVLKGNRYFDLAEKYVEKLF